MLPTAHASLYVPPAAALDHTRTFDAARSVVPLALVEAAQHSPPELYTLHASLLI
ncbi:MAG TPA: hypothetical protein VGR94_09335 [Candidatus Acidoferrales bacterium]|nr:hypothetical protein [Candidatus Acidoferrales bacterium]